MTDYSANPRRSESAVYLIGWILILTTCTLDMIHTRYSDGLPLLSATLFVRLLTGIAPFVILFLINNYLLIPRLLKPGRFMRYLLSAMFLLVAIWLLQFYIARLMFQLNPPPPAPHRPVRPIFTVPFFLDFIYDLLVTGINVAVALLFQQYRSRLDHESLMKIQAENRLTYLKAQINPHFYMNMLNNIHGMIEIDPGKAQEMIMDLSHLMRYVLYDSDKAMVPLSKEWGFITNYLRLLRMRYPENKVRIISEFPSSGHSGEVHVPALIFLGFVENAFKHGVSYRGESFVHLRLCLKDDTIEFSCTNSLHAISKEKPCQSGIGLRNARERLRLIYGDRFTLNIRTTETAFTVILLIPKS